MTSIVSSYYLLFIAYPLLFVIMGVFVGLTYLLKALFPAK